MKKIIYLFSALALMVSSCKKDDDTTPSSTSTATAGSTVPKLSDADGVFAAIITNNWVSVPFIGAINTPYGTAVGVISDATGSSTYIDAGTVKCDDTLLVRNSSNNYLFQASGYSATGLSFNTGNAKWEIGGNSAVAAFNYTTTIGFPELDSISSASTINVGASYTLATSSAVTNSDSVIFMIAGPNGNVMKTKGPGTTSTTFTSAELTSLGSGTGIAEIVPYSIESKVLNGKKYYFINENAVTKSVKLQ